MAASVRGGHRRAMPAKATVRTLNRRAEPRSVAEEEFRSFCLSALSQENELFFRTSALNIFWHFQRKNRGFAQENPGFWALRSLRGD